MNKHQYKQGDHILLNFEDYENEEFFVGWISKEECAEAIKDHYGDDCEVIQIKRHCYAFWGFGVDSSCDSIRCLYEREHGGRGRFKVTVAETKRSY